MANEYDQARENLQHYTYCRENGHEAFLRRTDRNQRFYIGNQWTDDELAVLAADNRPNLTLNEIFRTSMAVLGELSQHAADVRFSAEAAEDDNTAEALDRLYLHTAAVNNMEVLDQRVRMRGLLFGRGYYDVRVDFDENMMGQVKITAPRIQNIVLDADIDDDDPKTWARFFRTRWMSQNQLSLTYGAGIADDMQLSQLVIPYDSEDVSLGQLAARRSRAFGNMPNLEDRNIPKFRLIEQQYRREAYKDFFVDPETGDSSEVPENWTFNQISHVKEVTGVVVMRRRTSTIRWCVTCDDRVLHDEDSPYNDFTIIPYMPFFTDGHTFGLIDQMIEPQRMLNKAISQELHILSTTANSGWKIKTGSLQNMTIQDLESVGARTGLILELMNTEDAEKIQPNTAPSGFGSIAQSAVEYIHNAAGATPSMFGGAATSEVSGQAIIESLNRGPVNMSMPLTSFFNTKRQVAIRFQDLVRQFYTETRFVRITDPNRRGGETTAINQPDPNDNGMFFNDVTRGNYFIHILPAPTRFSAEQNAFAQMVELRRDLGVQIPDDILLGASSVPRRQEIIERVRQATGGDISPVQQQMQDLEMQAKQADLQKAQAAVGATNAQTDLATARAERARADSQVDGKQLNAQLGYARLASEHARDAARLAADQAAQRDKTALELTRMQVDQHSSAQDRSVKLASDLAKAKAKPKTPTPKKKK